MTHEQHCRLEVARIKIDVPVYRDISTTEAIGRDLDARIKQVAKQSDVIDTQKNAVIAAFNCLVQMHVLAEEHEEDIRELTRALARITTQMRSLEERFHLANSPRDKE